MARILCACPRLLPTVCLLALSARVSLSAVVYVNVTSPGPGHDGKSWSTAYQSVTQGLAASHSGDDVWVAKGSYPETVTVPSGVSLRGNFAGTETTVDQRVPNANPAALDGGGSTSNVVVNCAGGTTVIDGMTVRRGGDGIRVSDGSATLSGNTVTSCTVGVAVRGGAASLRNNRLLSNSQGVYNAASLLMVNNTLYKDQMGIYLDSGIAWIGNNVLASGSGAGVFRKPAATVAFFSHNDVYEFHGGYFYNFTPDADQGIIYADPSLSRSLHLQPGSPCIDAGDDSAVEAGAVDIDGQPRIQGAHVDIGADESDGTLWDSPMVWYVSANDGSDFNDGSAWPAALKTITAALSRAAAGSEVWVAGGSYPETITLVSGVPLYGGFKGTETTRDPRDWTTYRTMVDGGGSTTNVLITCQAPGAIVDGLSLWRGGTGFRLQGGPTTATITDCDFWQDTTGVTAASSGTSIVGRCSFRFNGTGISVSGGNINASQNTFIANGKGALVSQAHINLYSSLFSYNTVGVYDSYSASSYNNTFYMNGTAISAHSSWCRAVNNIIANCSTAGVEAYAHCAAFDHNDLIYNATDFSGSVAQTGVGNLSVNPQFHYPPTNDYHLTPASPCIDAGDDSVVLLGGLDLDGKPRILGPHVDIGAYEQGTIAPYTLEDAMRCLSVYAGTQACTVPDVFRLNVETANSALDLNDVARLVRKVAGLEPNP